MVRPDGSDEAVSTSEPFSASEPFPAAEGPPAERAFQVSVVIPNYNYAAYLRQCIDSVLAQDYEPKQVIVVDDGSTDHSRAVIESYGEAIVPLFKENGGQTSALNRGVARCTGQVVMFVDADDTLLPGALRRVAAVVQEEGVARAQGFLQVVDAHGQPTGDRIPGRRPASGDLRARVLRAGPGSYVCTPTSGNAWSRSFIDHVFPLPAKSDLPGGADALLSAVVPLFGKTATIDAMLGCYRIHGKNIAQTRSTLTHENLPWIMRRYRHQARFLERVAQARGEEAAPQEWLRRNWRMLTVLFLLSQKTRKEEPPSLFDHMTAPLRGEGPLYKRAAAVAVVGALRCLPHRLAMRLASTVIQPEYM